LRQTVPISRPTGPTAPAVNIISNYALPGVDWDYYRVFYRILGLGQLWPEGLTAHAAWQGKNAWRSFFLWNDEHTADAYFAGVGIETVTNTIRAMGVAKGPTGATDVVPRRLAIEDWLLGAHTGAFSGVGDDKDGKSIDVLGTRPVISELQLNARARPVAAALGFGREIPADLLGLVVAEAEDGCQLLQIWSNAEIARAALENLTVPALTKAGIQCPEDVADSIYELRLFVLAEGAAESFAVSPTPSP
jgi:hypothetical protein